jgi:protein-disulfide isomerase
MVNKYLRFAAILPLTVGLFALEPARAEQSKPQAFGPAEEQAIREIVRQYLLDHPEVMIESLQAYQEKERLATAERQRDALKTQTAALEQDPDTPVLGNPDGDISVVEFFDYRCPYCKTVADKLRNAVLLDGNVRLVMKEYPILGADSEYAARAALAATSQGLYEEFHFALMSTNGQLTKPGVLAVAKQVGLDVPRLEKDMTSGAVDAMLDKNFDLARTLDIRGTPAFVIGNELVPGALDMNQLKQLIADARANSS